MSENKNQKIVLFGAGKRGRNALQYYGRDIVSYFCDNSVGLQGTFVDGVEVISFEKMVKLYEQGYKIIITPLNPDVMLDQLIDAGIKNYSRFMNDGYRFPFQHYDETIKQNKKNDEILHELVAESRKLDLIYDTETFIGISTRALRLHKEQGIDLMLWGESNFYGNAQVMLDYAGISSEDTKYFPVVSHRDCFPHSGVEHNYQSAVVMSGEYYRERIHKYYPQVPYFSVGPYIQYASGIYDDCKIKEEKEKNGKTLVVFLPHSTESIQRQLGENYIVDVVYENYRSQFDTIFACVYWADLEKPICSYARKKGMKLVSAGFRFDTMFDRRLRTIIELSDAVACFEIGTFISYALWAGKPVARLPFKEKINPVVEKKYEHLLLSDSTDEEIQYRQEFINLFDQEFKATEEQKKWVTPHGGINILRSKEYIRNILEISKDIWTVSEGDLFRYSDAVRAVYKKYGDENQTERMQMLKQSLGREMK